MPKKAAPPILPLTACYCRVSTENQIENYSIDEQKERLEAFCKAKGWAEPRFFIDPGFSGGSLDRPALSAMCEQIRAGRIDTVVVYKLDRLSRSQKDTLYLIEDVFLKNNVNFVSVNENFDTSTPFGKAMIGILSVFAQLEKDQITERFTMGRIGRAKSGLFHGGGNAPTGYDYVDGHLVVNEFTSMQVKEVFERFGKGESVHSIQRSMHETYGGWESHTKVYNVLKNSLYIGKVKFGGEEYDGEHKPIITPELFYETQRLMTERSEGVKDAQKTPFRAGFMLSGLVYCGNCGARYHGNHGCYRCYSRAKSDKKYIIDPNCRNPNIPIGELDGIVCDEIMKISLDPSAVSGANEAEPAEADTRRATINARLAQIEEQSAKLLDLYQLSGMPVDAISDRMKALQEEKNRLTDQLGKLPHIFIDRRQEFLDNLSRCREMLSDDVDTAEKRMYVASLVRRVTVADDGSVKVDWRI